TRKKRTGGKARRKLARVVRRIHGGGTGWDGAADVRESYAVHRRASASFVTRGKRSGRCGSHRIPDAQETIWRACCQSMWVSLARSHGAAGPSTRLSGRRRWRDGAWFDSLTSMVTHRVICTVT